MSENAKREMKIWLAIKQQRMALLLEKFQFIPCEYCRQKIYDGIPAFQAEGHHNDRNRRHNSPENCRILHRCCNQLIEDENIKDILSLL